MDLLASHSVDGRHRRAGSTLRKHSEESGPNDVELDVPVAVGAAACDGNGLPAFVVPTLDLDCSTLTR